MQKTWNRTLPLILIVVMGMMTACAGARNSVPNRIETDPSVDNSVPLVPQETSYRVSGDLEVEVEDGTAFTAAYNAMLGADLDAFNIVMRPNGGSVPAVGMQGIPRTARVGQTYNLAVIPSDDEASVYFQEVLTISQGVYARSVEGTFTITARDDIRVSGTFEATLAPALTDGTLLASDARYTVSGSFENIILPELD
jgi:hypothetical protein